MRSTSSIFFALLIIGVLGGSVHAVERKASATAEPQPPTTAQVEKEQLPASAAEASPEPGASTVGGAIGSDSSRIFRDPQTGRLTSRRPEGVPPLVLSAEDAEAARRDSAGLASRPLARGGLALNLQGRFMSAAVARRSSDGVLEMDCVESPDALELFLEGVDLESSDEEVARDDR